jgi:hypothetical protein
MWFSRQSLPSVKTIAIGEDEGAKFTKGETVSLDKILYGKLRVKQDWKTKHDILDTAVREQTWLNWLTLG